MNLHEHQAKALLRDYGIPMPSGTLARSVAEAAEAAHELGGEAWAVKAQIHAGLRQKAGGVRLVNSVKDVARAAEALLGTRQVTPQTGAKGKLVKSVYVEQAIDYARQLYLALLVDRATGRVAIIAAAEGGNDIEERLTAHPEQMRRLVIDPDVGVDSKAVLALARDLGLADGAEREAARIMEATYHAFMELDASLIEFNPLVVTNDGRLLTLDAKLVIDDNALFRHPSLEALRDEDELDPSELEAKRFELNYVQLEGNIGVMVNGAGLALATVDLLKEHGGEPADFMDIRPEASREQVASGFRLLLANPKIKAILVNIYGGGILRCDTVAEGIAAACRAAGLKVPLIVRAAGTNGELARQVLVNQGITVRFAESIGEAAIQATRAARGGT
jgi:succinyl-CoA synthetase beta subunit